MKKKNNHGIYIEMANWKLIKVNIEFSNVQYL